MLSRTFAKVIRVNSFRMMTTTPSGTNVPYHQSDAEAVREFTGEPMIPTFLHVRPLASHHVFIYSFFNLLAGAGQPTPNSPTPMTVEEVDFIAKSV
jgi:hypothetical protein